MRDDCQACGAGKPGEVVDGDCVAAWAPGFPRKLDQEPEGELRLQQKCVLYTDGRG